MMDITATIIIPEAMMAHLVNVTDILPKLLACSEISRFDVFGNLDQQATEAVNGLGAKIFAYYNGYTC